MAERNACARPGRLRSRPRGPERCWAQGYSTTSSATTPPRPCNSARASTFIGPSGTGGARASAVLPGVDGAGLGALDEARALVDESAAICGEIGDRQGLGWAMVRRGLINYWAGDPAAARPLVEQGIALLREVNDAFGTAWALTMLGAHSARSAGAQPGPGDDKRGDAPLPGGGRTPVPDHLPVHGRRCKAPDGPTAGCAPVAVRSARARP